MDAHRDICPICGARVEGTGFSTRVGIGSTGIGRERAQCEGCRIKLVRNPDDRQASWFVDRDDNGVEQCRARLRYYANANGLEYQDATQNSPDVWRCYIYKPGTDGQGARTVVVHGSERTEEGALQEMLYEAEVKGLLG